eukprot:gene3868-2742_t
MAVVLPARTFNYSLGPFWQRFTVAFCVRLGGVGVGLLLALGRVLGPEPIDTAFISVTFFLPLFRLHKRKITGGKVKIHRKRMKAELGRLPGNTRLGERRVSPVRARGGNFKLRGLRLDTGNFAWGTEAIAQHVRILDVVYNSTSNELVRTKTLVKNCIVSIDASPFKQWYAKHYGIDFDADRKGGKVSDAKKTKKTKKSNIAADKFDVKKASPRLQALWMKRRAAQKIEQAVADQLRDGRLLARLTSRPGQTGRADGILLEGAELQFYLKKLEKKKNTALAKVSGGEAVFGVAIPPPSPTVRVYHCAGVDCFGVEEPWRVAEAPRFHSAVSPLATIFFFLSHPFFFVFFVALGDGTVCHPSASVFFVIRVKDMPERPVHVVSCATHEERVHLVLLPLFLCFHRHLNKTISTYLHQHPLQDTTIFQIPHLSQISFPSSSEREMSVASVEQVANCIRCLAADVVQGPKSGHPGTPMGMAPVSAVLWSEVMKYNSKDPQWFDRDRFVLSNGHACALLYSMLHLSGYDLPMSELQKFRQIGSKTPGHPERFVTPGVEVTTGPLGQGVANAVGLAMAEAHLAATFNRPGFEMINHYTYVFCGDGCLQEGVCQEALSLAGHLKLEKLIVVYDSNHISIDGETSLSFTEESKKKYEALGFNVLEVKNGDSDFDAIRKAIATAKASKGKPTMIIQTSTIGFGSKNQGTEKVHGAPLGDEDIVALKAKFGRSADKYAVEEPVYAALRKQVEKNAKLEEEWKARVEEYCKKFPAEGAQLKAQMENQLPEGWEKKLPLNDKPIATRKASENCLGALFPAIPALVGGSADLTPSNLTRPASANLTDFCPSSYQGRYFRFGVREHAMLAILNGLDAHGGLIPFGATFLNFVAYGLGAVRLAALCHHRTIYVATHDSIGLGEDGPTHQPVELVSMLRAMPNLYVFRPSDQTETSGAWAAAVSLNRSPSVLCLSRQNTIPQPASSIEGVKKGGYTLQDASNPQLIIISSGTEISLALDAAKKLSGDLRVRVVSMPCQELFDEQPEAYQASVLPDGVPVVSVEPYVRFGWDKYSHYHVGMDSFGASGPAEKLYEMFHITADEVAKVGRALAARFPNNTAPLKRIQHKFILNKRLDRKRVKTRRLRTFFIIHYFHSRKRVSFIFSNLTISSLIRDVRRENEFLFDFFNSVAVSYENESPQSLREMKEAAECSKSGRLFCLDIIPRQRLYTIFYIIMVAFRCSTLCVIVVPDFIAFRFVDVFNVLRFWMLRTSPKVVHFLSKRCQDMLLIRTCYIRFSHVPHDLIIHFFSPFASVWFALEMSVASVEQVANCIRCLAADVVQGPKSGHPGTPMGMAPVSAVLWSEVMKYNSKDPQWFDRDRFVLSNGHACALLYSMLHLSGYDLPMSELQKFRQIGSKTPGHPERFVTPGVEVTTGPLGQGVANAVGLAMAEAHLAATFNRPGFEMINHYTYVFCGDGCLQEGVCQEALSLAGHLKLEKLIVVYDSNHISIDGETSLSFTEESKKKYEALGFNVLEVKNGDSDFDAIRKAIATAKASKGKPTMIIQTSTIGFGSKNQGTEKVHGAPLGDEDIVALKAKFGRSADKYAQVEKNAKLEEEWKARVEEYCKKFPAEGAQLKAQMENQLPEGWEKKLPLNDKPIATRKASENCLGALFPAIPALQPHPPASANLTDFCPSSYQGRYFRFGVREHAMLAILNGLDAHGGLIPFGATFLNFVAYGLGAVRLAALCHHRTIYVATHDSIGLGEDGPTHQPVELVSMLRAMPNLYVFRPSDQTETSGAWAAAVSLNRSPSVLCLSRQNTIPQPASSIEGVKKGGYTLQDASNPQLIIISSGTEISLALDAAKKLSGDLRVRVVSMPCQELFDEQPEAYQASVLPDGVPVVSVEPYVRFGWDKYSHYHVGMDSFGASGPAEKLYEMFHITADEVAKVGRALAARFPNNTAPLKRMKL